MRGLFEGGTAVVMGEFMDGRGDCNPLLYLKSFSKYNFKKKRNHLEMHLKKKRREEATRVVFSSGRG